MHETIRCADAINIMKNYHIIVEKILELKQNPTAPRRFETEHNNYHHHRIQPTDIDIITAIIEKSNISKFDFAAELYCRTLLAQIAHFKYTEYFGGTNYENSINRFHFVETVGWCPTRCQRHIHPIVLPLFILYWNSDSPYMFYGSDNPSEEDAKMTLETYYERLANYKLEFIERALPLFDHILYVNTPKSTKLEILKDFANFSIALN